MGKVGSFKTYAELEGYIRGKLEDAMDEVYDRLLDKLLKIIEEDIYSHSDENKFYKPTKDLLERDNWEVKRYIWRGRVYRAISFKGENLTTPQVSNPINYSDPKSYIHGNYMEIFEPQAFLKMLNNDVDQGDAFGFPQVDRRPFWDDFMDYCDKYYSRLFKNACKRNGIELK